MYEVTPVVLFSTGEIESPRAETGFSQHDIMWLKWIDRLQAYSFTNIMSAHHQDDICYLDQVPV